MAKSLNWNIPLDGTISDPSKDNVTISNAPLADDETNAIKTWSSEKIDARITERVGSTATDLAALTSRIGDAETTVTTKANQADLDTLSATVSGKASQTDLDALSTSVSTKASQTDLDTLASTTATSLANKANNATVAQKANQTDVDTALATKANTTTTDALDSRIATLEATGGGTAITQATAPSFAALDGDSVSDAWVPGTYSASGDATIIGQVPSFIRAGFPILSTTALATGDNLEVYVSVFASDGTVAGFRYAFTVATASLYDAVVALGDPGGTGRTSANTLKVPGVDALPTGASISGKRIYVDGADVTFTDWNFAEYSLQIRAARTTVRQCLFRDDADTPTFPLSFESASANCVVEDCTFVGTGDTKLADTFAPAFIGFGGTGHRVSRVHLKGIVYDGTKGGGTNHILEDVFVDHPHNIPLDVIRGYDAGTFYPTGTHLLQSGNQYLKLTDAVAGTPVSDTSAWKKFDPHTDLFTIQGGTDFTLRRVLIVSDMFWVDGGNNLVRVVRDTHRATNMGNINIHGIVCPVWNNRTIACEWVREYTNGQGRDAGLIVGDDTGSVPVYYQSQADGTVSSVANFVDPTKWVATREVGFQGPVAVFHCWLPHPTGTTGNDFGAYFAGIKGQYDNLSVLDYDFGTPIKPGKYSVIFNPANPGPTGTVDPAFPTPYGPATAWVITPTSFQSFNKGDGTTAVYVNACVFILADQVVGWIEEDGTINAIAAAGVTITDAGGGSYRMESFGPTGAPLAGTLRVMGGTATVTTSTAEASVGPAWGTGTIPASAATTTLADGPRDRMIYDSRSSVGESTALVPAQGTDAPSGATIDLRVMDVDDALVSQTNNAATADGSGAWSGTMELSRSSKWGYLEARANGGAWTRSASAHRIAAGHVIALWQQSEHAHMCYTVGGNDSIARPSVSDPEAVQMVGREWAGIIQCADGATGMTGSMAAWADQWIRTVPGEKVMLIWQTQAGTSWTQLTDDDLAQRSWATDRALHDLGTANGSTTVGLAYADWYAAPGGLGLGYVTSLLKIFFERDSDNNALTLPFDFDGATVEHSFVELYGDYAATRWLLADPHRFETSNNVNAENKERCRIAVRSDWDHPVANGRILPPNLAAIDYLNGDAGDAPTDPEDDDGSGWYDTTHPSDESPDGLQRLARLTALSMAKGIGAASFDVPVFDQAEWEASGAYMEAWSSLGAVSTRRLIDGDPAINTTTYPWATEVAGFRINGVRADRAEIVAGRVRVYPLSGGTFTGSEVITFGEEGATGNPIGTNVGGWSEVKDAMMQGYWKNLPVVDVGVPVLDTLAVLPLPDPAVLEATIGAGASTQMYRRVDDSGAGTNYTKFDSIDANDFGTGKKAFTFRFYARWTTADITEINQSSWAYFDADGGRILFRMGANLTSNRGSGLFQFANGATSTGYKSVAIPNGGIPTDGSLVEVMGAGKFHTDVEDGFIWLQINGSEVGRVDVPAGTATPAPNGQLDPARSLSYLASNGPGEFSALEFWWDAVPTTGAAPATGKFYPFGEDLTAMLANAALVGGDPEEV